MQAGKLRHKGTIQQLVAGSPSQTATGQPDTAWTDLLTAVSASIEPLRGRELVAAQAVGSKIDTRIRLRYRSGITAAMRFVFGSTYYNIEAVLDLEMRHVELQLLCSTGMNDG